MSTGISPLPWDHRRNRLVAKSSAPLLAGAMGLLLLAGSVLSRFSTFAGESDLEQLYLSAERAFRSQELDRASGLFSQVLVQSYLLRGRLRQGEGRYAEAVEDLEAARKLEPENRAVRAELGTAYFAGQRYEPAVKELESLPAKERERAGVLTTLGQAYFSLGRLHDAQGCFARALALKPSERLPAYFLGVALLSEKDRPGAARVFAQLKREAGESAQFRLLVGRAYLDTGYHREAEAELRRALELDPKIHYAHHLLGVSALQEDESGRINEAQREFEAEVAGHRSEFSPLFMLGVILEMKRDWARAKSYLLEARELEPHDADVFFHLGHVELEAGQAAPAASDLERSMALTKTASHSHFQVGRAHFLLSRAYRELGDPQKSASEAEAARRLSEERVEWEKEKLAELMSLKSSVEKVSDREPRATWEELRPPGPPDTNSAALEKMYTQVLANSYNRLGLIAAQAGRFEEAVDNFGEVVALQADFPRGDFNFGLAAFRAERLPQAIAAFERAVARDPSDAAARELLGRAQFEHGDFAAALPNLQEARAAHLDDPGLLLALGACLARAHRTQEAEQVFAQLLKAHSNLPELHVFLGQGAYAQGQDSAAEKELRNALSLDPHAPQAHFYLGIIALDRGDLPSAEREFASEIRSHPEDQKARYHLAFVLLEEQKREAAFRLLEGILKSVPGYAEAHYSLGKALIEADQLERGITELETAVRLDPDKAYSHYQLGRAYLRAGKTKQGEQELVRAQELKASGAKPTSNLDPDNPR